MRNLVSVDHPLIIELRNEIALWRERYEASLVSTGHALAYCETLHDDLCLVSLELHRAYLDVLQQMTRVGTAESTNAALARTARSLHQALQSLPQLPAGPSLPADRPVTDGETACYEDLYRDQRS